MSLSLEVRRWLLDDVPSIINYFLQADDDFLKGMGADPSKLPSYTDWKTSLEIEFQKPAEVQDYFYMIWLCDGQPVGHCNVNLIKYGRHANMHLHMWQTIDRQKGLGALFVKKSLPTFFERFDLEKVVCEPYALNPAPNKTLPKAGFQFVKKHVCIPGPINFEQEVSRWEIGKEAVF